MKINPLFRSLLLVLPLGLAACDKLKEEQIPQSPKGDIVGKVTLYSIPPKFTLVGKKLADMSGVTVEALIGEEKFTTLTHSDGTFSFPQVPNGSYSINFRKENFRGFDSLRFDHLNPVDSLNFAVMTQIPKARITVQKIDFTFEHEWPPYAPPPTIPLKYPQVNTYMLVDFLETDWSVVSMWLYFSKDRNVSSTNYDVLRVACCMGNKGGTSNISSRYVPVQRFYEKGFVSGDKV